MPRDGAFEPLSSSYEKQNQRIPYKRVAAVLAQDVGHELAIGAVARLQDAVEKDGVGVVGGRAGQREERQGAPNAHTAHAVGQRQNS